MNGTKDWKTHLISVRLYCEVKKMRKLETKNISLYPERNVDYRLSFADEVMIPLSDTKALNERADFEFGIDIESGGGWYDFEICLTSPHSISEVLLATQFDEDGQLVDTKEIPVTEEEQKIIYDALDSQFRSKGTSLSEIYSKAQEELEIPFS